MFIKAHVLWSLQLLYPMRLFKMELSVKVELWISPRTKEIIIYRKTSSNIFKRKATKFHTVNAQKFPRSNTVLWLKLFTASAVKNNQFMVPERQKKMYVWRLMKGNFKKKKIHCQTRRNEKWTLFPEEWI